jgi:hypothetical protein
MARHAARWSFEEASADELAALDAAEAAALAARRSKVARVEGVPAEVAGRAGTIAPCGAAAPLQARGAVTQAQAPPPEAQTPPPEAQAPPPEAHAPPPEACAQPLNASLQARDAVAVAQVRVPLQPLNAPPPLPPPLLPPPLPPAPPPSSRAPPIAAAGELPLLCFHGRVETAATAEEVDAVVRAVYASGHAVGWDIEWRVTFERGAAPQPVALMQLALPGSAAGGPVVYLLQLAHTGLTPQLARLLCDASVIKAGCAARNDAHKVARDFGLTPAGVVDVSDMAAARLWPPQRWSLAALVARLLARQLPKPPAVRLGAWDARVLSREQEAYAALDAWASLRVHAALAQLPLLPPPTLPPPVPGALPLPDECGACAGGSSSGAGSRDIVPATSAPGAMPPAKREVHAQHCAGVSVAHIAAARGIRASTVESYLGDIMCVLLACRLLHHVWLVMPKARLTVCVPALPLRCPQTHAQRGGSRLLLAPAQCGRHRAGAHRRRAGGGAAARGGGGRGAGARAGHHGARRRRACARGAGDGGGGRRAARPPEVAQGAPAGVRVLRHAAPSAGAS